MSTNEFGNVFLLRHGQTISNKNGYWSNFPDEGLTEDGISQALQIGKLISGIEFDKVYTSPMKRCLLTIEHSMGRSMLDKATKIDSLKERNLSGLMNMTSSEIESKFGVKIDTVLSSSIDNIEGVENSDDFVFRTSESLKEIFSETSRNHNVLIVSHGGTMCSFLRAFLKIEPKPRTFLNCAFMGLHFDGKSFQPKVSVNMKEDWYAPVDSAWRPLTL